MARDTMTSLISRLRGMLAGTTSFSDDDLQSLLDDHAFAFDTSLVPRAPFYVEHEAPYENIEVGCRVYVGYNTLLTEEVDYTIDLSRGVVTTPAADHRGLQAYGTAYDLNAAAADGWERIAAGKADQFDLSADGSNLRRSQLHEQALTQAAAFRKKAWATQRNVERSDSARPGDAVAERLRDGFRRQVD